MTRHTLKFFCAAFSVALISASAHADGSSIVTVGVGAGLGIHKTEQPGTQSSTSFINQANVRIKALYFLGLDYSYDMSRNDALVEIDPTALRTQAKMRLSGLLYPYSGDSMGFYLGGGVGGATFGELFKTDSAGNSYQVGAGLEFHFNDHISLDMSFYMVIPGTRSIETSQVAQLGAALASGDDAAVSSISSQTGVADFVSAKNHEFMIRLFLFL